MPETNECNFDGLVGPTHNYAGLSLGNIASMQHTGVESNPKEAALQGLLKMKLVMSLGIPQAVFPPHERPNIAVLRSIGFRGDDLAIIKDTYHSSISLLAACYSSSHMWTANAATVSPSVDSGDKKLHLSVANLVSNFHRAQEAEMTYQILKKIFIDENRFAIHEPLLASLQFSDEGAANHNRFCVDYDKSGIEMFVYGKQAFGMQEENPSKFPARQTLEASQAIARRHQLLKDRVVFINQKRLAIEKGAFHNDVVSVANQSVFFYHEDAFLDIHSLVTVLQDNLDAPLYFLPVTSQELPLEEAIKTYLFNSQLITVDSGAMCLLAPEECRESPQAMEVLSRIIAGNNPIQKVVFVDCRQSMQNGGGPACLRLRVVMTEQERQSCLASVFLDEILYEKLVAWVNRHYRDKLSAKDFLDPQLLEETRRALDELTQILNLGALYSFQKT